MERPKSNGVASSRQAQGKPPKLHLAANLYRFFESSKKGAKKKGFEYIIDLSHNLETWPTPRKAEHYSALALHALERLPYLGRS